MLLHFIFSLAIWSELGFGIMRWESGQVYFGDTEVKIAIQFVSLLNEGPLLKLEKKLSNGLYARGTQSLTGKYTSYNALICY